MSRKNYTVDEVIRSLSKKGCVITLHEPITKTVNRTILPSQELVDEKFVQFVQKHSEAAALDVAAMGNEAASVIWIANFQKEFPHLFTPKTVKETVVVQAPFTVNTSSAKELGNGSWGKIDFLTNHRGFTLMRSV